LLNVHFVVACSYNTDRGSQWMKSEIEGQCIAVKVAPRPLFAVIPHWQDVTDKTGCTRTRRKKILPHPTWLDPTRG